MTDVKPETFSLRTKVACLWHERWDAERVLMGRSVPWAPRRDWLDLCNRTERLRTDVVTEGRECLWKDSSPLTVSRVFPQVGPRLLRHVMQQWPIVLEQTPVECDQTPDVSVLIAIGGTDRLPQFHLSLKSVLLQQGVRFEVIVVEQSPQPQLEDQLPAHVVYRHQPSDPDQQFNKSRALNLGAEIAKGGVLAIHDGDYVLPNQYLARCLPMMDQADGMRPARWIVHLDHRSTQRTCEQGAIPTDASVEKIIQNNPTPMLCTKSCYWDIGGHDESFIGWGGEDLEFLSRLRTHRVLEGGFLPVIHLWHPPAAKKASGDRNQTLQDQRMAESPQARIARLRHENAASH